MTQARTKLTSATAQMAATFGTKLLSVGLGVPVSIILARALGPDGRGQFVAASAVAAIGMQLGNLGLHTANTHFVSRDRSLLGPLVLNSLVVAALVGTCVSLAFWTLRISGLFFANIDSAYFLMSLVWIPLGIGQVLQQNLMVGIQQYTTSNKVDIATRTINLFVCAGLWWLGVLTPAPYLVVAIAVAGGALAFTAAYLLLQVDTRRLPSLVLLRAQVPYGVKVFLASLFAFLVVRSDVLLLQHFGGNGETGQYSIAVSLVDILYLVPVSVGVVLFPQLSGLPDATARWRVVSRSLLHTGWIIGAGAVVLMVWGEAIIRLLFGDAFRPAYGMLVILAPAMLFYGLNNLVSIYLAAEGLPWFGVWVWVVAFALNLVLNLLWVPTYGGVGAAWSSLVVYIILLFLQLHYVLTRSALSTATNVAEVA